jgi:Ring finger domain
LTLISTVKKEHSHADTTRISRMLTRETSSSDIPLYIIHVSRATHERLSNILQSQSLNTTNDGGTQISIDDNRHSHRYYPNNHHNHSYGSNDSNNSFVTYTALTILVVVAVFCCIMLICGTNDWDDEAERNNNNADHNNQSRRPVRQKLTRQQVRDMFPIYRYDGHSKLYRISKPNMSATSTCNDMVPNTSTNTSVTSDSLQQPLLQSSADHNVLGTQADTTTPVLTTEVIEDQMLDVCSICLDEYVHNDTIRILPTCHHIFHSKCVGRWLSERSAVCPLCKDNVYVEPPPEEDDDDDNDNRGAGNVRTTTSTTITTNDSSLNAWQRFLDYLLVPPTTNADIIATTTPETTTTVDMEEEAPQVSPPPSSSITALTSTTTTNTMSSSWWSRMFPVSLSVLLQSPTTAQNENDDNSTTTPPLSHTLMEPLLPIPVVEGHETELPLDLEAGRTVSASAPAISAASVADEEEETPVVVTFTNTLAVTDESSVTVPTSDAANGTADAM